MNTLVIGRRKKGKSSMALYNYLLDYKNNILVVNSYKNKMNFYKEIRRIVKPKQVNQICNNILVYNKDGFIGRSIKKVIIDDISRDDDIEMLQIFLRNIYPTCKKILYFMDSYNYKKQEYIKKLPNWETLYLK